MTAIRCLHETDWPAILSIQGACYPPELHESLAALQSHALVSPETCWVGVEEGQVVGYLLAHPWTRNAVPPFGRAYSQLPHACDTLFLHDLAVDPRARGCGAARALVHSVFGWMRNNAVAHSWLIAIEPATSFWHRFGFRPMQRPDLDANIRRLIQGQASLLLEWEGNAI